MLPELAGAIALPNDAPIQNATQQCANLLVKGGGYRLVPLTDGGSVTHGDLVLDHVCAPIVLVMGGEHARNHWSIGQEALELPLLVLLWDIPLQRLTAQMLRHCPTCFILSLTNLHNAHLDHLWTYLVKSDVTVFFMLLGPCSRDMFQTLLMMEFDGIGLAVMYKQSFPAGRDYVNA